MVIVTAMQRSRWVALCEAYEVVVPSIIAGEMEFFDDDEGRRHHVQLEPIGTAGIPGVGGPHRFRLVGRVENPGAPPVSVTPDPIAAGKFEVWSASTSDLGQTDAMLHPSLRERVHVGEREAVTYLRLHPELEDVVFVTADVGAIHATVELDRSECAMSLETVLAKCGQSIALDYEYTAGHVTDCVRDGQARKLQGWATPRTHGPATRRGGRGRRR